MQLLLQEVGGALELLVLPGALDGGGREGGKDLELLGEVERGQATIARIGQVEHADHAVGAVAQRHEELVAGRPATLADGSLVGRRGAREQGELFGRVLMLAVIDEERAAHLVTLGHERRESDGRHGCVEDRLVARLVAAHDGMGAKDVVAGPTQVDGDLVEAERARRARGDRAHHTGEVGARAQQVAELHEAREEPVGTRVVRPLFGEDAQRVTPP